MNTTNNNDTNPVDDDMNWKVVGGRTSETPLRNKAKETEHEHAETSSNAMESGGTIEVRFMIDPKRRREFNMCLRLREFIVEAGVMDPTFSILPLGGDGGESITKADEWPSTKEGIDKY
jgi:hypothetical protein